MNSDDVIWQIINNKHCCFKVKTETQKFCTNEYNLTGLCNKLSCPLSNSNYATVVENKGQLYLCMKTAERQYTPNKLWEKIKLSNNYEEAFKTIEEKLQFNNPFQVHKCK